MNVEQRLLNLADSFAEQASEKHMDAFTAQVFGRLGLTVPSGTASSGGADPTRVGPSGGGLREGEQAGRKIGERGMEAMSHCRSSGTGAL